jgi:hypothetical protein
MPSCCRRHYSSRWCPVKASSSLASPSRCCPCCRCWSCLRCLSCPTDWILDWLLVWLGTCTQKARVPGMLHRLSSRLLACSTVCRRDCWHAPPFVVAIASRWSLFVTCDCLVCSRRSRAVLLCDELSVADTVDLLLSCLLLQFHRVSTGECWPQLHVHARNFPSFDRVSFVRATSLCACCVDPRVGRRGRLQRSKQSRCRVRL